MFFQSRKVIESIHTLLHHLKDSLKDLTELDYYPCTSQIVVFAHPKRTFGMMKSESLSKYFNWVESLSSVCTFFIMESNFL